MYTTCSPDVLSLQFSIFMNNLSSYCGIVNAKIRASNIDLPVRLSGEIMLLLPTLYNRLLCTLTLLL
jgi:hypothetical protein